jgi:arylsulfatase A-like enzyme
MWDVHHDYIPPPPYDSMFATAYSGPVDGRNIGSIKKPLSPLDLEHLVALYDGEIAWTDSHIGKLLDLLDENSLTDETLVIVTSDHGEEFFEHQKLGHRRTLFDESICIPLVMRCPRLIRPGLRISHQVSILDIAPTVLDLASLEPMNAMLGQSLVALIDGGDRPGSASVSELEHGRNSWIALRTLEWKLIVDRTSNEPVGLWDLQRDPAEQRSIYEGNAALRKRAEQALTTALQDLEELRERHPLQAAIDAQPLPAEIENQLRKLGYLDEDESER